MDVDEVDRRFRRSARTSSQNYKEDSEEEDESGLEEEDGFSHEDSFVVVIDAISSSRAALKTLAHEYSNEVREDKYESYRFFTLVLKIAGYERYVSKEDVKSDDCVEMISEDFEGTSMLSDKGKETKKLMKNLESFVLFLFKEIELDSDILSHFLEWLGELSRSRKRAIRHVATVVVNYVITSFCQRCNFIEEKIVNLGEKIQNKEVVEDGNDYTSEIEEIENQIGLFYEAVFIQRYRDVDFHIRSCCISELSKWVDLKPNLFSDSNNLRYFGWFLSDPEYLVRNSCLNGVNYLMKKQERVVGFRSWIERFRNRIIEIAKEDDHELNRITAIEIIKFSYLNGMISDELIKEISLLMFDSHLKVRNSMSEFMKTIFLQEEKIVEKVCYFLLNIKDEFYELFFSQINLKDLENLESILEISKDDQNEINVSALKLLKVCCDVEKSILVCELVECITFPLNEKEEKVDGIWDDVKRCFLMNSNNSKISSVISHLMNQQNIIEKSLLKLEELKSLLIESEDEERIFNLSKKMMKNHF
ncbi:hypothetical protein ROZALSC1DRAFT_22171 [Rozella allomycis CSF55]|uniref:SCD domain-containing protein n=1 Tax=Rozella allomycis (strain CSF55) TaxID=988480 RepID=A0A4P9YJK5_ROZAC|nr:hypothetical protein ROZALSC1DRAFT_22171 [Rozella allomycis CSF55]